MRTRVDWEIPTKAENLSPEFITRALRKAGLLPASASVKTVGTLQALDATTTNPHNHVVKFDLEYEGEANTHES